MTCCVENSGKGSHVEEAGYWHKLEESPLPLSFALLTASSTLRDTLGLSSIGGNPPSESTELPWSFSPPIWQPPCVGLLAVTARGGVAQ